MTTSTDLCCRSTRGGSTWSVASCVFDIYTLPGSRIPTRNIGGTKGAEQMECHCFPEGHYTGTLQGNRANQQEVS